MLEQGIITHAQLSAIEVLADLVEHNKLTRMDAMKAVMKVSEMKTKLDEAAETKSNSVAKERRGVKDASSKSTTSAQAKENAGKAELCFRPRCSAVSTISAETRATRRAAAEADTAAVIRRKRQQQVGFNRAQ